MALLFDIESNGLLDVLNTVHVLVIKDTQTKEVFRFRSHNADKGALMLQAATKEGTFIVAHNGIKFDIPALKKLYPWFSPDEKYVRDTLVMARLMFPDLLDDDLKRINKGKMPKKLLKRHTLEAWGWRLGQHKIDYLDWCEMAGVEDPWGAWSQEMEDYCVGDVLSLEALWDHLNAQNYPELPVKLEHDVAWIMARQERYGFWFDTDKAATLYTKLVEHRLRLEGELKQIFTPRFLRAGKTKVPKANNSRYGYMKDAPLTPVKLTEFNPGSRDHVAVWFKALFGWKPKEFTNDGKPKVDETVLLQLPWGDAKKLAEFYMVTKRLGQLAEGDEAWLRHVQPDHRIHGSVITNGAVTGRMTHAHPNCAQVPANRAPYGEECRSLFAVPLIGPNGVKKALVGADASALELRCLAGYMALWDNGAYIKVVVDGKKEDGSEIHSVNRRALQIESRDDAKTWFYAFIYGGGDEKLGLILLGVKGQKAIRRGKESRAKFLKNLPALGKLVSMVQLKVEKNGCLKGLDGRVLHIRSKHSALNTLLQSAGAIIMKAALVVLDKKLQALGYIPGINYEFVANVHDEWQIECDETIAESIGKSAVAAMEEAGRLLKFRCPITGEYSIGRSWAETH